MSVTLQEQIGLKANAQSWEVGDFRLWQSTVPEVILYAPRVPRLVRDSAGRLSATLNLTKRWQPDTSSYVVDRGMATLGFLGDVISGEEAQILVDQWSKVLLNSGYPGPARPKFLPLPMRDVALSGSLDQNYGEPSDPNGAVNSKTVRFSLTPTGATAWLDCVHNGRPIAGGIQLTYSYPQILPASTSTVETHGIQIYQRLAVLLRSDGGGTLYGNLEELKAAWEALVREGAVQILVTGAAHNAAGPSQELIDTIREQLFDSFFEPYARVGAAGPLYALRWRNAADVPDFPFTVKVSGWTWLTTTNDISLTELISSLDDSNVSTTYAAVSLPTTLVVEPCDVVDSVAISLDFGDLHVPEASNFDCSGGTRQYVITTTNPKDAAISYAAKVIYQSAASPVFEMTGTAHLGQEGYTIDIKPEARLRRHSVYMYVRKGQSILPPEGADPTDYLTITASYTRSGQSGSHRTGAKITPLAPVQVWYPVEPGDVGGHAILSVAGVVQGDLVGPAELEIDTSEESLYVLVQNRQVKLVGRNTLIDEADAIAAELRYANARPIVTSGDFLHAETNRALDVDMDVILVPQPTNVSCWAAAMAMVVSFRDQMSIAPQTIGDAAGMDVNTGYAWPNIQRAVQAWNLAEEGSRSSPPEEWAALLEEWGPIWLVEIGAPYHAVVLGAVWGDGSYEGTWMKVYNPWPPNVGVVEWKTFLEFDAEFGQGAGAGAAMVHAQF